MKARTTSYAELLRRRDGLRPSVVAEPTWTRGVLWPTLFDAGEDLETLLTKGVQAWWRTAVGEDYNITHTHCIGRGDTYCHFCVQ